MYLLLILPILVSGFIYCNKNPYLFYKINRYDGQYLYLQSARYGLMFFGSSVFIASISSYLIFNVCVYQINIDFVAWFSKYIEGSSLSSFISKSYSSNKIAFLSTVFVLNLFLPLIWCLYINRKDQKRVGLVGSDYSTFVQLSVYKDSPVQFWIMKSLLTSESEDPSQLMFSMSDRKVYVGVVIRVMPGNELTESCNEIVIRPIMSGYRDKDNLTVDFKTHYADIVKEEKDKDEGNIDFELILKQESISTITPFDFDTYKKFDAKKDKSDGDVESNAAFSKLKSIIQILSK